MADVLSVGVNLEAFSQAINAIQALRSSVSRVFDCLKDGMRNKETLEGREKAFISHFQDNLHSVNRDLKVMLSHIVGISFLVLSRFQGMESVTPVLLISLGNDSSPTAGLELWVPFGYLVSGRRLVTEPYPAAEHETSRARQSVECVSSSQYIIHSFCDELESHEDPEKPYSQSLQRTVNKNSDSVRSLVASKVLPKAPQMAQEAFAAVNELSPIASSLYRPVCPIQRQSAFQNKSGHTVDSNSFSFLFA
ncbi:hypothetical protein STEG23_001855 [Scotinomys teguina]